MYILFFTDYICVFICICFIIIAVLIAFLIVQILLITTGHLKLLVARDISALGQGGGKILLSIYDQK